MKPTTKTSHTKYLKSLLFFGVCFVLLVFSNGCQSKANPNQTTKQTSEEASVETTTPASTTAIDNYERAKNLFDENPNDPDALIWLGRRAAYLGNYDEAIEIFSIGIQKHPKDARLYRHRGHRYISTRQYDKAIKDLEEAVSLIKGKNDQIEPDGLPNSKKIPLTTLHGNIWYHLGLAYYLINDMDNALRAFSNRTVTERYDDNIVSGGHWQYMILSRQGKTEEAKAAINRVTANMDIIENESYYKMCLFYKQLIPESALLSDDFKSSSSNVLTYGLGNWYLYKQQDTLMAKKYYKQLLENGNTYSFAYLAAESDWHRIFDVD